MCACVRALGGGGKGEYCSTVNKMNVHRPPLRHVLSVFYIVFSMCGTILCFLYPQPTGFVSIDCGLSDPPYVDERTDISYVSDDGYIETGEKKDISSEYKTKASYRTCLSLRSFPSGGRNCYTVPTTARGRKYLVRAWFMHGNYDGGGESLASRPVKFDLYIGLDFWYEVTVSDAARTYTRETITVAVASSLSVCLLDTGNGTPFISSLELRPMSSDMYPDAMANQSLGLFTRYNMGESNFLRPVFSPIRLISNFFCFTIDPLVTFFSYHLSVPNLQYVIINIYIRQQRQILLLITIKIGKS